MAVAHAQGDFEEVERLSGKIYRSRVKTYGEDDERTMETMKNQGIILLEQGGKERVEKGLQIIEKVLKRQRKGI